ncbi:hypothetical protein Anapl_14251 [Anas platyrhynchos]|uniref:Uncharacterized protein n=1 Tax=Anas platyrhynchos TaxID=8839 RepID=R0KTV2_ANAPL|nr:hypothetical protein Anapl_14251 [Anas platyrhynchos]
MPWSCRCCGAQGSSARVLEAGAGAVVVGWCPENRKEEMQSQDKAHHTPNRSAYSRGDAERCRGWRVRVGEPCLLSLGSLLWRGGARASSHLAPTDQEAGKAAGEEEQMWFSLLLGTAAAAAPRQGRAAAAHLSLDALAASAAWFLAEMDSRIYCRCWLPNPFSQLSEEVTEKCRDSLVLSPFHSSGSFRPLRQSCAAAVGEASLILYHCGEHFLLESCSEIKVSRALMPMVGTSRKNPEQQQSASKDVSTHGKTQPVKIHQEMQQLLAGASGAAPDNIFPVYNIKFSSREELRGSFCISMKAEVTMSTEHHSVCSHACETPGKPPAQAATLCPGELCCTTSPSEARQQRCFALRDTGGEDAALVDKSERVLEVWTAAKLFGSQALITAALGHCPYQYFGPPVLLKQICLFPLTILNSRDGAVHEFSSFQKQHPQHNGNQKRFRLLLETSLRKSFRKYAKFGRKTKHQKEEKRMVQRDRLLAKISSGLVASEKQKVMLQGLVTASNLRVKSKSCRQLKSEKERCLTGNLQQVLLSPHTSFEVLIEQPAQSSARSFVADARA